MKIMSYYSFVCQLSITYGEGDVYGNEPLAARFVEQKKFSPLLILLERHDVQDVAPTFEGMFHAL